AFERAACGYEAHAILQKEVGEEMLERLGFMRLAPERILDVGAGTGRTSLGLMKRYPGADVIALDIAHAMLREVGRRFFRRPRRVCGEAEHLPFPRASMDLVFSNLTLQWCLIPQALSAFRRVLRAEGLLMLSTFGPDTLRELRESFGDGFTHTLAFPDIRDLGEMLMQAGFQDPVLDVDRFTLTYASPLALMRELKAWGAHNVTAGRRRGLTGKGHLAAVLAAYEAFRLPSGGYPATFEVIHAHAWAPKGIPLVRG
ncbi:MAG: malonyl-[acyl-carrier protein] O-methyltransferase BioC, partial [Gammaproteobacteria bacterium]